MNDVELDARRYDLVRVFFVLTVLALIAHIPLIFHGYPRGHDASYHLKWLYHFSTQFKDGDLYPRWLMGMSSGLGGPSFYYYPPAAYYLSAALSFLISPLTHPHYVLAASALLLAIFGAFGIYLFCRSYLSRSASFVASIFFLLIPYRIVIDLYMRGDIAELASISVIPYLFLVSRHMGHSSARAFLTTALTTSLIVLTHPLVAMIALPFSFSFKIIDALENPRSLRMLIVYCGSTFVGMALASFYIVPALLVENSASAGWDLFIVYDSFLFNRPVSPVPLIATLALAAILASTLIALIGWTTQIALSKKYRQISIYFIISSLICTFMLFEISAPVYRIFSPLERMQFPWRYTTILSFFACVALAFLYDYTVAGKSASFRGQFPNASRYIKFVLIGLALVWLVLALVVGFFRGGQGFTTNEVLKNLELSEDAPEYRLSELARQLPVKIRQVQAIPETTHEIERWEENSIELQGDFKAGSEILLARQYFGRWQEVDPTAAIRSSAGTLEVSNKQGLVHVEVLQDTKEVLLVRDEFKSVIFGNAVSTIAAFFLLLWLMTALWMRKQRS